MTLRLGLAGVGIGHSRSPVLHAAGLKALNRPGRYERFEAPTEASFLALVARLRAGDLDGLNVTTPWKHLAAASCDQVFRADATGGLIALTAPERTPVNTLFVRDGLLCGTSTDGPGLGLALELSGVALEGRAIAVIGAGGAGASVAHWLMARDAPLRWISNRSPEPAERLVAALGARPDGGHVEVVPWAHPEAMASAEIVIHASRVGHGQEGEEAEFTGRQLQHLPWQAWAKTAIIVDLVYGNTPTAAQRCARAAGAPDSRVLRHSGASMLACQAALSLGIWTGTAPPVQAMQAAMQVAMRLALSGTSD